MLAFNLEFERLTLFDKALLKLSGMRGAYAVLLVGSFIQAALIVAQTIALATCLSNLWGGQSIESQFDALLCFLACFVGRRIVDLLQEELHERTVRKTVSELRSNLLSLSLNGYASLAKETGSAAAVNAATEGIEDISRYMRIIPKRQSDMIAAFIVLLVSLFAIDWISGTITLVAFPVIMFFMIVLGKQAKSRAAGRFHENERLSNHFIDTLRGIQTIQSLHAEKRASDSVFKASERLRAATVKTLSVATLSSAVLDLIGVFGVAAVAMMLAFRLMDGSVSLYVALAALMLTPECFAPIRAFASEFHASLDGKNALASVCNIIESYGDVEVTQIESPIPPWNENCRFEARGVSYSFDGARDAVHEASFSCNGNAKIGIVGASGAGKSTLIDLLAGFIHADAGSMLVNGEIVDLRTPFWRDQLHYIPQHPYLFNISVADNVRLYAPEASMQDVERACHAVGLDKLPGGLDAVLGEGGRGLSGGEAQRVAVARALLGTRRILLFDEPTAHLDIETELELKRHMLDCMEGKLVFFATHRLHWIADMDIVIVMENGEIAEMGPPANLLAHDGALKRFMEHERMGGAA